MNPRQSNVEKRLYNEWLELCDSIRNDTNDIPLNETAIQQKERVNELLGDFEKFCAYYFPHYYKSKFGWFHKKAARIIQDNKSLFIVLEWAREHAKSVFANVFMPLFLYSKEEITGMVTVSANEEKAKTLLSDLQAEFASNNLWIHDFGEKASYGNWSEGHFSTTDGFGFWAFGRGQSPRGIRKAANRPNYTVIDDIDDKIICRNDQRVRQAVDWVLGDLYGALSIKDGGRVIIAGNRIHKKSILANLVGDIEPEDPKRKGIKHIKVYALENPKTKEKDLNGVPSWKERYTKIDLKNKMLIMGFRNSMREYFHEHIEEGLTFKNEYIYWSRLPHYKKYSGIEIYCDPSFKETKDSDYKAIVVLGKIGKYFDIIDCWIRVASISNMVKAFYGFHAEYGTYARYRIEANMLQDLLLTEFDYMADEYDINLPIRPDKRKKPNKVMRIENLSPFFQRGLVRFNEAKRKSPDMQTLKAQFLSFPFGKDDGPDACEGGFFYLNKGAKRSSFNPRSGKINRQSSRI